LKAQNNQGAAPSTSDLEGWADTYGLTFPVLSDDGWGIMSRYEDDNYIPSHTLLGPGAEVIATDANITDSMIESVLPN